MSDDWWFTLSGEKRGRIVFPEEAPVMGAGWLRVDDISDAEAPFVGVEGRFESVCWGSMLSNHSGPKSSKSKSSRSSRSLLNCQL